MKVNEIIVVQSAVCWAEDNVHDGTAAVKAQVANVLVTHLLVSHLGTDSWSILIIISISDVGIATGRS
jgi:hypothetical protein